MAIALVSVTVDTTGRLFTLTYSGFGSAPTVTADIGLWPVITVGAGGHGNILKAWTIGTPTLSGGNYEVVITMVGYAYSGETVVFTQGAAFMSDGVDSTPVSTAAAVANNSTKTQGLSYTRIAAAPVVAWAMRDAWRHHENHSLVYVALDAVDNWSGVLSVDIQFSGAVTVNADASVSHLGSNLYRIATKRLVDLLGYGELPYWYLSLDISAAADGLYTTVTQVTINTHDGQAITCVTSTLATRRVYKLATKTTRYVDGTTGSDANTGLTAGTAWATIAFAETTVGTTVQTVKIAPGTYALTQDFDTTYGYSLDNTQGRNREWVEFAARHYRGVIREVHATLTKRPEV